jgi:hypothetical protein
VERLAGVRAPDEQFRRMGRPDVKIASDEGPVPSVSSFCMSR